MKTLVLFFTLSLSGNLMATTFLKPDHDRHEARMSKQLGLSESQEKKIKEIKSKYREANKEERKKIKGLHEELDALMDNDGTKPEVIRAKHKEIQALRSKSMDQRFEEVLEIRAVLLKDQIKKFSEMRKKMKHNRKERRMPFHD